MPTIVDPVTDGPGRLHPPPQVRTAGVLVGVQGLATLAAAVVITVEGLAAGSPIGSVLGEAALFVVLGAAVTGLGGGLLTGRRGARTPAIVVQLLLLPAVYSLIGPSQQLVPGLLSGVYVAATFLLLISEPSRRWAVEPYDSPMGADDRAP